MDQSCQGICHGTVRLMVLTHRRVPRSAPESPSKFETQTCMSQTGNLRLTQWDSMYASFVFGYLATDGWSKPGYW